MPEYSPIPPYTEIDWASIPAPVECGEELVDLGEIVPEITYDASYAKMGFCATCKSVRGSMRCCL